jgi:hypothetical protein
LPDSNPFVFRSKIEKTPEPLKPSVRTEHDNSEITTDITPTPTEHELVTGVPYTATVFELEGVFNELNQTDQKNIRLIDHFVKKNILTGRYSNTTEAAKQIITDLETKLNLTGNNDPYYRISKIAEVLSIMREYES